MLTKFLDYNELSKTKSYLLLAHRPILQFLSKNSDDSMTIRSHEAHSNKKNAKQKEKYKEIKKKVKQVIMTGKGDQKRKEVMKKWKLPF